MIQVRKMTKDDLLYVSGNSHRPVKDFISYSALETIAEQQEKNPHTFTVVYQDKAVFCAGASVYWPGRAEVWGTFVKGTKALLPEITLATRKELETVNYIKRLELSVEYGFKAGIFWAKELGFHLETEKLTAFYPNGKDAHMFVRIN